MQHQNLRQQVGQRAGVKVAADIADPQGPVARAGHRRGRARAVRRGREPCHPRAVFPLDDTAGAAVPRGQRAQAALPPDRFIGLAVDRILVGLLGFVEHACLRQRACQNVVIVGGQLVVAEEFGGVDHPLGFAQCERGAGEQPPGRRLFGRQFQLLLAGRERTVEIAGVELAPRPVAKPVRFGVLQIVEELGVEFRQQLVA